MSDQPAGAVTAARRLYAWTLLLLPRRRRDEWRLSLQAFFDEASLDAHRRGALRALWLQTARSIADVIATAWRERVGDRMRLGVLLAAWPHELHVALRGLRRTPSVAFGAVVTIALGAGVGTALFVLVHAAMLAPLPFADAGRLVSVSVRTRAAAPQPASYPEYLDWRDRTRTLAGVAGYSPTTVTVAGLETPIRTPATLVTANFFALLGVPFAEGRAFEASEEWEGRDAVAIVTDEFRRRHFAGVPVLVGREIRLGDRSYRIVGVLARGFRFDLRPGDLFLPLGLRALDLQRRDSRWLNVIGRRVAEASPAVVQNELTGLSASTGEAKRDDPAAPIVVSLRSAVVSGLGSTLWLLSAASLLLAAAAAASLGGLAVTRTLTRTREFAVRVALGASDRAVMLAVVTELACLGAIGIASAVAVGLATVRTAVGWLPAEIIASAPYLQQATPLGPVLLTATLLVVTGCAPAALLARRCVARTSTTEALRAGAAAARAGRSLPFAGTLVACQVAMAVVLLIGAGLLGRSVSGLLSVDPGFSTARLSAFGVSLPRSRYPDDASVVAFYDEMLQRVRALPNVERAGTIDALPFTKDDGLVEVAADDRAQPGTTAVIRSAAPGYLETLGLDARAGRLFDGRDRLGGVS
ncbi:MAG TPA: ABC transporter permease, partial [Vicinamibacterales bacterium]|nr:ABC transporter permease [Vicinamibacterales bacterium]